MTQPAAIAQANDCLACTRTLGALMTVVALAACGGGDPPAAPAAGPPAPAPASVLTFSAATPAVHNTTADPGTAASNGNDARAADSFSSGPYCDIFFEDFMATNGKRYALQVYFRQTDQQPLNVSVIEATPGVPSWLVFQNNSGNPITGITVNISARTLGFASKSIIDVGIGNAVTLSGTVAFQANASGAAGCGL